MAEAPTEVVESVITFDLITYSFRLDDNITELNLTQDDREKLDTIFETLQAPALPENQEEIIDFQQDAGPSKQ